MTFAAAWTKTGDLIDKHNATGVDQRSSEMDSVVERAVTDAIRLIDDSAATGGQWKTVHKEEGMVVSRTELEVDGQVVDRSRTVCRVPGVTARDVALFFYSLEHKEKWDSSIDSISTLEQHGDATVVCHILHKRVWPTAQRDSCIASHVRELGDGRWIVVNESVDHTQARSPRSCVRATSSVALMAKTVLGADGSCHTEIQYLASVNPGGWAPASVVRALSAKEYPKVLRKLSEACREHAVVQRNRLRERGEHGRIELGTKHQGQLLSQAA